MLGGEITGSMFIDTCFTIAHNGGPIFNKAELFNGYGNDFLPSLLNLQHEGKLLPLVINSINKVCGEFTVADVHETLNWQRKGLLKGWLDAGLLDRAAAIGSTNSVSVDCEVPPWLKSCVMGATILEATVTTGDNKTMKASGAFTARESRTYGWQQNVCTSTDRRGER
jgi:hypothetical protein